MVVDPRISLTKLEILDVVVSQGGVTRAADHLGVSQPVVTAHVRSLERQVGCQLFARSGRQVELTECGRVVHAWAKEVLRRTRELERDLAGVSDGYEGKVAIATSMSIGSYRLPPLFSEFLRERPSVELKVDIIDAAHAISAVEGGEDDLSVVVMDPPPLNPNLLVEKIGYEELAVVVGASWPQTQLPSSIAQLGELPFVEAQEGSLRRSFIEAELRRVGLGGRRVAIQLGHPEAMKQVVMAGLGVACLFRSSVVRELESGSLKEIRLPGLYLKGPLYLIYRRDKLFSAAQSALLARLRAFLAAD